MHLEVSDKHLGTLLPVILELQRCRPGLRIERHTDLTQLPQFSATNGCTWCAPPAPYWLRFPLPRAAVLHPAPFP